MRVPVDQFSTHIRMQVGSQQFPSRGKQADIFDARDQRIGFLNQYGGRSFTVYLSDIHADGSTNLFSNHMQVRNFLTRVARDGRVEWH